MGGAGQPSQPRSVDPLAAATSSLLLPVLKKEGFKRRSRRRFDRIGETTYQVVDLQRSAFGSDDFCVNYASMSLIPAEDHLVLTNGSRLLSTDGAEIWWPASSQDQVRDSIAQVAELIRAQALPFFEATKTADGMVGLLCERPSDLDHHQMFELGASEAWIGETERAVKHLESAVKLYEADGRDWCQQPRNQASQLILEISTGHHLALLESWRAQTLAALGRRGS
jgi:hypothetical protein